MPLQQTSGNVTQDAYGGGAASVPTYVENVFSTYLYIGTGATQSITNNIPLSTKGGMVWIKDRTNAYNHNLFNTTQGATKLSHSNTTAATATDANSLTAFNTTGFTLGSGSTSGNEVNVSNDAFASWTFRKQPKFFDIVTYTGNGTSQTINHNLGSTPGFIVCKSTTSARNWLVYHQSLGATQFLQLDTTIAATTATTPWNNTAPTSTNFTVGSSLAGNENGQTFVAYLFGAGGTGGFGLTGTQDIISCGNYTGNGSTTGPVINLGWEPQWVLVKSTTSGVLGWYIQDIMRGMSQTNDAYLVANTTDTEVNPGSPIIYPTATGFSIGASSPGWNLSGGNYIYIAIRRGPMAVPTDATKVFYPYVTNPSSFYIIPTNFPVDMTVLNDEAKANATGNYFLDRLRGTYWNSSIASGSYDYVDSTTTSAEQTGTSGGLGYSGTSNADGMTAFADQFSQNTLGISENTAYWNFRRAPSFFDEVCYTGNGANTTISHNLQAVPQLMIVKNRSNAGSWAVYNATLGNTGNLYLQNSNAAAYVYLYWNNTTPTSTVFSVNASGVVNASGQTYVAYLFATCAGVSYVGSYTGNGTGQSIACGFGASGARFVLIKRTDSTGNWYCFDSANGLTSSSSPYLLWNSTAAQTTGNNGVYASNGGFTLGATAITTTNIATASYIFLAIA